MGGRLHIYDTYRAMHGVTQKKKKIQPWTSTTIDVFIG